MNVHNMHPSTEYDIKKDQYEYFFNEKFKYNA